MPVYTRNRKTGLYRRRRNIFWRRAGHKAAYAVKEIGKIKRQLNVEKKWLDIFSGGTAVSNTPTIVNLVQLTQGTTAESRVGDNIKVTSLRLKLFMTMSNAVGNTLVRCMIILDKQPNGAQYAAADLFEQPGITVVQVSSLNLQNKYRFKIMLDKTFTFSNTGEQIRAFDYYKELMLPVRFQSNNGDITDVTTNALSLLFVSNRSTSTPSVIYFTRQRYVDN